MERSRPENWMSGGGLEKIPLSGSGRAGAGGRVSGSGAAFDNNGLNASKVITKSHLKSKQFHTRECALKIVLTRSIFQPKMHQISFGGRAPPGPAGELTALSSQTL